ncbi:MAG TPA: GNAT family N-acetyltransferase, partial [Polyangiaceae bacterium]|nr:GNAT family N-acetyltransferase [Polyangiaceae bacterium]
MTDRKGESFSASFAPPFSVRAALAADANAIVQLVESAYRGDSSRAGWTTEADLLDGQRTDMEQVAGLLINPAARILIARTDRELLGSVLVEAETAGVAHIGMFAVRPSLQGRGIGRALLEHAELLAREVFGAERAQMSVIEQRSDILAWYRRLGYRQTGATEPFPYGNPRFGLPRRADL